jgi:dTDP-4-dehydrorhamnose reductase
MGRAPHWKAAEERPVVVLGAGGMLATALVDALEARDLHYVALGEQTLDITYEGRVTVILKGLNPVVVINAAAYTDVDGAEADRALAYEVNAVGAGNVASAAFGLGARVIHISTDYVFDGLKGAPYSPDDKANPINVYGASKLEGENLVRENNGDHLIVRTSWLYGPKGKNFVTTMLDLGCSLSALDVVDDQTGSPTYTRHLAAAIIKLIYHPFKGICHLTNAGQCTWNEFAREIFLQRGMQVEVRPVPTEAFPRPALRPPNSVLDCTMTYQYLGKPMPFWQVALEDYLKEVEIPDA